MGRRNKGRNKRQGGHGNHHNNNGGGGGSGGAAAAGECPHLRASVQLQNITKLETLSKEDFLVCKVRCVAYVLAVCMPVWSVHVLSSPVCLCACVSVCASGCVRWVLSCSRVRDWSPRYALLCRRSSPNHPSNHITSLCVCVALHGRQLDDGTTSEHGPLWVCLTCAAVGCGQNDAGKHGLEHYDVKHHPIALAPETMQCWWVLALCSGACTLLHIAVTWLHCLAQVLQVR